MKCTYLWFLIYMNIYTQYITTDTLPQPQPQPHFPHPSSQVTLILALINMEDLATLIGYDTENVPPLGDRFRFRSQKRLGSSC